jgi:hypothetical protein
MSTPVIVNLPILIFSSLAMEFLQLFKVFTLSLNLLRLGSPDLEADGVDGTALLVLQGQMVLS